MATYRLNRKLFFQNPDGTVATPEQVAERLANYKQGKEAAVKANGGKPVSQKEMRQIARDSKNTQSFQKQQQWDQLQQRQRDERKRLGAGDKSVLNGPGIVQGLKNTWNNSGNLGKAGMAAAGVAGGYMMYRGIKSMFRRKPKPQPQQAPAINIYTNAPYPPQQMR